MNYSTNSFLDYNSNDINESIKSYDYFDEIDEERNMNPSLFSDPYIEVDELKFKNQLLFDKISSTSSPSDVYIDVSSDLNFTQNISANANSQKKKINKNPTKNSRTNKNQKIQSNFKYNESQNFKLKEQTTNYKKLLSFKERYNQNLNPRRSRQPEKNILKQATEMQEKLIKMKKENEKLNRNYREMLYKVDRTRNDVQILQDALANSHFERLAMGHYEWSNYAEKSF